MARYMQMLITSLDLEIYNKYHPIFLNSYILSVCHRISISPWEYTCLQIERACKDTPIKALAAAKEKMFEFSWIDEKTEFVTHLIFIFWNGDNENLISVLKWKNISFKKDVIHLMYLENPRKNLHIWNIALALMNFYY